MPGMPSDAAHSTWPHLYKAHSSSVFGRASGEKEVAKEKLEAKTAQAQGAHLQLVAAAETLKRLHQKEQELVCRWDVSMAASQR